MNESDITVASFEGIATGGSINLDSSGNYRRTGNLQMVLREEDNLIPNPESKIWFNKRIGVHIGLQDWNDEILWFNMGRFAITNVNLDFNSTEKTISCDLLDYMAFLDGTLGGELSHETRVVAQGATINQAITAALGSLGKVSLDNVEINGSLATVPMDIEMSPGSTVYDLVKQLSDLYKNYTFYFNDEGYFRLQQIKNHKTDAIVWDFTDIDLSLNYSRALNFANVKNNVWIWGKQLENGTQIVQNYKNKYARNTVIEMNTISDMATNDICHVINDDMSYVWDGTDWELLTFTVVPDFRSESIGDKILALSHDEIYTEEQVKLRCEYELTNYSNWAETVSFDTVPIYALKPEEKIKLYIPEIGIDGEYLTKSITIPLDISGSSSIQTEKIYY